MASRREIAADKRNARRAERRLYEDGRLGKLEYKKGKRKRPGKREREAWNNGGLKRDITVYEGGAPGLNQQRQK